MKQPGINSTHWSSYSQPIKLTLDTVGTGKVHTEVHVTPSLHVMVNPQEALAWKRCGCGCLTSRGTLKLLKCFLDWGSWSSPIRQDALTPLNQDLPRWWHWSPHERDAQDLPKVQDSVQTMSRFTCRKNHNWY